MADPETHNYTFRYKGVERYVEDAVLKPGRDGELLVGHEVRRGAQATGVPKAYRVDRIDGLKKED